MSYEKRYNSFVQQQRYMTGCGKKVVQVHFGCDALGKRAERMISSSIADFVSNYRKRLSTEWAPADLVSPDPPMIIQPAEIYHRHVGQVPNYAGHIPGAMFRFGKTYGNDSRDGKRWLRGDFS